ncbi:N-acetyl-gamma-glutamyl-phosphate reductase [Parasphingopyxis marina]|uniref:N-acetyl-gamma-glutamyl-phosphate reductase n=1 Tax=Parasphingopyxis marina TaxID=2761622 RepID=A0A842I0J9_9SPHN|nr:N-acetyl-gamma-glutamyl-phosphate reductase [Parasphingopyxis marina]MBC2778169.1 N-acetyl-gamma-glutamyl-phosphate reductase [Parasphingopyxis marina]
MTISVFIDGGHGTTGLEIRDRLAAREEIALIELGDAERKDEGARRDALHAADFAVLCLPDDAARAAVALAEGANVRIIDASTAHRTTPGWVYGFPELEAGRREEIAGAARVSNHGCYAATFLALVRPLVRAGLLPADYPVTVNATSGYSGGGKAMIAEFESGDAPTAFRNYALALQHKHIPEMHEHSGLDAAPLFSPSVANTYRGMIVEVPLHLSAIAADAPALRGALAEAYAGSRVVTVLGEAETAALDFVTLERCADTDRLEIMVFANPATGQARLCAALDNLGKGAAGNAVQSLNIMAGFEEITGLRL